MPKIDTSRYVTSLCNYCYGNKIELGVSSVFTYIASELIVVITVFVTVNAVLS